MGKWTDVLQKYRPFAARFKEAHPAASFRLMLFAPFNGEVIVGKVMSSTPKYIRGQLRSITSEC